MSHPREAASARTNIGSEQHAEALQLPLELSVAEDKPRQPPNTHTDLPLPHGGNGGSRGAPDPSALLVEALVAVPQPPIEQLDADAVLAWVEAANTGLVRRRQRLWLAHKVEHVLWDEWRTAEAVARKQAAIEYRAETMRARRDGTYWAQREQNRLARRVIHVEVDRDAWLEVKGGLRARGRSAGVGLGRMLTAEAQRVQQNGEAPLVESRRLHTTGAGRRANLTTRAAIDDEGWAMFSAVATATGITIARYAGLTIEARSWASPPAV